MYAYSRAKAGRACEEKKVYYVYILRNSEGKHYIGSTEGLKERIKKHNSHGSRWTKYKGPWSLLYQEECETKTEAIKREHEIKSYKGGNAFKRLVVNDAERSRSPV